jgi:hypothetical protein
MTINNLSMSETAYTPNGQWNTSVTQKVFYRHVPRLDGQQSKILAIFTRKFAN